jgi:ATP-binding cassette, subfamily C, bacterial LapB
MNKLIQFFTFDNLQSALALLSFAMGSKVSSDGISNGMPLNKGNLSEVYLAEASVRAGLNLRKLEIADAKSTHCPLLLTHKDGRAMVLSAIKPGGLGVAISPAGEANQVILADIAYHGFLGCWSVLPATARDSRTDQVGANDKRHWIIQSLWMNPNIVASVAAATIAINVLALAVPLITMNILDRVVSHAAFETLWALALGGVVAVAGEIVLRTLRGTLIDRSSARGDVLVMNRIFGKVLGTRLSSRSSSVGVQSNSLREFESLREISNSATLAALGDLPFAILFLLIIYMVAGPLVLVPIAVIPILLLCGKATQNQLHHLVAQNYGDTAHKNAVAVEVLANMETVKAHAAENWAASKWERAVASQLRHSLAMRWYMALSGHLIMALQGFTTIAILVAGVYLISMGQISAGALFATSMLAGRALSPIAQIAMLLSKIHHAKSAYGAIRALVDADQERPDGANFISCKNEFANLTLDQVELIYRKDAAPAVKDLSMQIHPGERIAIVGGIGSGKSTLLRIIIGLRSPTSGSITLDGVPVQQLEPSTYRQKFGTSFREEGFFFGSIRENLGFHRPLATDAELIEAARLGGALAWIKLLPTGFDSKIGENGSGLSSGQRQTLALSRAFVGNPDILLLDEPTSDLDSRSELDFVQRLRALPPQKTLIAVTHRPAVIDACSRLIVIDNGTILMDGEKTLVLARLKQITNIDRAAGVA